MGNSFSRWLENHRFLGLAVCHSTTADPRRLEHYNYTYWTGEIASLILRGRLEYCLIAPQFPMYVSPKEPQDPNSSMGSGRTQADGDAEGVYVDIAIIMPIVEPRDPQEFGVLRIAGESLFNFFTRILPGQPHLSPRCLWVSGFEAALLGELKPMPSRHVTGIQSFMRNLTRLLGEASPQAEAQAICLFCSARFATQDKVLILAGAGDYYRLRLVTRAWSGVELEGFKTYSPRILQALKNRAKLRLNVTDDGDWTEGNVAGMYGRPEEVKEMRKKTNGVETRAMRQANIRAQLEQERAELEEEKRAELEELEEEERAEQQQYAQGAERRMLQARERADRANTRAEKREEIHKKYSDALNQPPSTDRTTPLFSVEALNAAHKLEAGVEFFEATLPEVFFTTRDPTKWTEWTRVLQLGSEMSDKYMIWIQNFIRAEFVVPEQKRRKDFVGGRTDAAQINGSIPPLHKADHPSIANLAPDPFIDPDCPAHLSTTHAASYSTARSSIVPECTREVLLPECQQL
ncbi:hypothetical protein B0H12DRAFT_1332199 [Mycena haematopus]|nr:hypothetical protein B0H12DRAFT_1332199 [Mycena haematopus]